MLTWMRTHQYDAFVVIVCFFVATGIVFARKLIWPPEKPSTAFVSLPPANGMPKTADSSVELTIPLKTYSKKVITKKLKLAEEIVNNPVKEVTATASLKPTKGGYTVVSITDTSTGVTNLVAQEKPRSVFGFGGESEIGLLGGVTNHGSTALVFARQDLLRIGSANLFGAVGVGVTGDSFAAGVFAGVSVKW